MLAMLGKATEAIDEHESRLKALPRHQKNAAFTIYEKMPPVKLYRPPGTPGGSTLPGCQSDKEEHGTPCNPKSNLTPHSGSVLTATPSFQQAETDPANNYQQQLTRLLSILAERKRDVLIDIPAAPYARQYLQIRSQVGVSNTAHEEALQLLNEVLAARDAWVTHIDALEERDCATGADARRSFDLFSTEYGLADNVERAEQLEAMLRGVSEEVCKHWKRIKAFPGILECLCRGTPLPDDLLEPFTIVGKMPPVKLCKLPGTPGGSKFAVFRSYKEGHGTPCHPKSDPMPGSGSVLTTTPTPGSEFVSTRRPERQQPLAPKPLQAASQAKPRPYCVFCRCHDHWSSDCPTNDFHVRWAFVNEAKLCQQCLRADHRLADCEHANRRCKHCAARHNAAQCPKAYGPAFQPATPQSDPVTGHSSVATAAGDRSPPGQTAAPSELHRHHRDDRFTTTNPLDTKPRSSPTAQPSEVPPRAAAVEPHTSHHLADAITSFFQRNSAGSDVVVGFYGRTQDNAGRTFYRILKPLAPSFPPSPANDLNDHLQVDHVIMLQTTAHVLPRDSLLSSSAFQDADSLHST
ncbi:Pao retrotransposon peptidase family protein [Aphelenchoides avenae]|nr:Pao retrotransposon peptidase family protein [Aphelenchus avenae]